MKADNKELLDKNDVQNLKNLGGQVARFYFLKDDETYALGAQRRKMMVRSL